MPVIRDNESDSDMDQLYSENEEAPMSEEDGKPAEVEPRSELISKKLIMGKSVKAGDKIILEVVKDYGDEVEVRYATEDKKPEMSEDEELSALAE